MKRITICIDTPNTPLSEDAVAEQVGEFVATRFGLLIENIDVAFDKVDPVWEGDQPPRQP